MNVLQAAREVARSFPGGAAALAKRIGKNATTFSHELNPPATSLAKLGLATAIDMTAAANDNRILHAWAQLRGFRCVRLALPARDAASDLMTAMLTFSKESAEALACMHRSIADGRVTENEIHRFEREVADIAEASVVVAERLRLMAAEQSRVRAMPKVQQIVIPKRARAEIRAA